MTPARHLTLVGQGTSTHDVARATADARAMNEEAEKLLSIDPQQARKLARSAIQFAERHGVLETEPQSRFIEGTAISFATDFVLAEEVLKQAAAKADELHQTELANRCRNGIATIYERMGEYGKSCEMLHNCLAVAMATHDVKGQCRALTNLGNLHARMDDHERAVNLLEEASARSQSVDDALLTVTVRANLAEALVAVGRYDEGLDIGLKCQEDAQSGGYRLQWGFIGAIIVAALIGRGELDEALRVLEGVIKTAEELGERDMLCDALLKQAELAQLKGSSVDLDQSLSRALQLAETLGIRQLEMRAHQLYATVRAAQGDYRAAFEHQTRELAISNILKEQTIGRKIQVLAVELSVAQHQRRADEEKQRSEELVALNQRLTETLLKAEHYASHDSLTELLNRRKFLALTEEAVARAEGRGEILGLAFVDLDGFKQINDRLGHDVGDSLLIEVARRLKHAVRGCDLVARAGGDEFMVLLRELTTPAEISNAVERIGKVFDSAFILNGVPIAAGGSVGHAVFPLDGESVKTLRIAADRAMYAQKRVHRLALRPSQN